LTGCNKRELFEQVQGVLDYSDNLAGLPVGSPGATYFQTEQLGRALGNGHLAGALRVATRIEAEGDAVERSAGCLITEIDGGH
jgi:hypothetical protein